MGYAVSAGVGVLIGIGLLIWGLRERAARHKAERRADGLEKLKDKFRVIAEENVGKVGELEDFAKRLDDNIEVLEAALKMSREQLLNLKDPEAISAWLAAELKRKPKL